jgi:hypothetical protein
MPKWGTLLGSNLPLAPKFYTGNNLQEIQQTIKHQIEKWRGFFFNGVQVGVEILISKISHENGDIFKNGLSKKGVEYF